MLFGSLSGRKFIGKLKDLKGILLGSLRGPFEGELGLKGSLKGILLESLSARGNLKGTWALLKDLEKESYWGA